MSRQERVEALAVAVQVALEVAAEALRDVALDDVKLAPPPMDPDERSVEADIVAEHIADLLRWGADHDLEIPARLASLMWRVPDYSIEALLGYPPKG